MEEKLIRYYEWPLLLLAAGGGLVSLVVFYQWLYPGTGGLQQAEFMVNSDLICGAGLASDK